ncbi:MAG: hypothetical protein L0191_12035, partial [Acidobacteria bacterium]|nr:hypothetical protein [Acidobacteriota bacterium]
MSRAEPPAELLLELADPPLTGLFLCLQALLPNPPEVFKAPVDLGKRDASFCRKPIQNSVARLKGGLLLPEGGPQPFTLCLKALDLTPVRFWGTRADLVLTAGEPTSAPLQEAPHQRLEPPPAVHPLSSPPCLGQEVCRGKTVEKAQLERQPVPSSELAQYVGTVLGDQLQEGGLLILPGTFGRIGGRRGQKVT